MSSCSTLYNGKAGCSPSCDGRQCPTCLFILACSRRCLWHAPVVHYHSRIPQLPLFTVGAFLGMRFEKCHNDHASMGHACSVLPRGLGLSSIMFQTCGLPHSASDGQAALLLACCHKVLLTLPVSSMLRPPPPSLSSTLEDHADCPILQAAGVAGVARPALSPGRGLDGNLHLAALDGPPKARD